MKSKILSLVIAGSLCSQIAGAQLLQDIKDVTGSDNVLVKSSLAEIEAAHEQSRILFKTATTNEQKERLRYVNDRLDKAENLLRQMISQPMPIPPPPPIPNPVPAPSAQIEMYKSDSCNGSLVGVINNMTNCQSYKGASDVWAIKVNGKCMDIQDMSATLACETFKEAGDATALKFYKSDSCNSALSAIVTTTTNCESLSNDSTAWAVNIGGQCRDMADTSPKMACRSLRGAISSRNVEIYKSDSCNGSLVAIVDRLTQCQSLKGMPDAWAIKVDGKCQDITDIDVVTACERFKPNY